MNTLLMIVAISILLSSYWFFKKQKPIYLKKFFTIVHFTFLGLVGLIIYLLFHDLRFIGQYTNSIFGLIFLSSGIILFGLTTSKIVKIYSGFIAIPTLIIEVSLLCGINGLLLPGLIIYLMFAAPLKKEKINEKYNLEIHEGGLMAPPNLFYITKQTGLIFNKQTRLIASEHLTEILKIEIISFKENESLVCRIYSEEKQNKFSVDTLRYDKEYGN